MSQYFTVNIYSNCAHLRPGMHLRKERFLKGIGGFPPFCATAKRPLIVN